MSWSAGVSPTVAKDFVAAVNAAQYHDEEHMASPEHDAQLAAAKKAVIALFKSGAVGPMDKGAYIANMSGHANPDHNPRPGYADSSVNVGIQQVELRPEYVSS